MFTDPKERARAIGVWGGVVGISLGIGPIVGGALTETIGWRSIFWINVPIGIAALVLAALFIPESRAPRARRVDPVGQLLVLVLLVSVSYAIINRPRAGWGSAQTWGLFALAVIAVPAVLRYEPRRTDLLIELRFFRSLPFAGATVIAVCAFGAFSGFLFLNTLYLQDVRHLSALGAGLFLLPMAVVTSVLAPVSGRVVGSHGPAAAAVHRRSDDVPWRRCAHGARQQYQLLPDGWGLHRLRNRFRDGECPHHQHGRIRYATGPGRRRGGGGIDESSGPGRRSA